MPYKEVKGPGQIKLRRKAASPKCEKSKADSMEPEHTRPKTEGMLSVWANPCGDSARSKCMKSRIEVNKSDLDMP